MMLIVKWILTILFSFIILGIVSLIKWVDFMNNVIILFLNIEGSILIAFSLSPSNPNWHTGFIAKLKWIIYGQPANEYAEPLVPNLLMLYVGLLLIILANILSTIK